MYEHWFWPLFPIIPVSSTDFASVYQLLLCPSWIQGHLNTWWAPIPPGLSGSSKQSSSHPVCPWLVHLQQVTPSQGQFLAEFHEVSMKITRQWFWKLLQHLCINVTCLKMLASETISACLSTESNLCLCKFNICDCIHLFLGFYSTGGELGVKTTWQHATDQLAEKKECC